MSESELTSITESEDETINSSSVAEKPSLLAVRVAIETDVGVKREENQDFYGILHNEDLLFPIVADGMGGAKGGATASKTAVAVFEERLKNDTESEVDEVILRELISEANNRLYNLGSSDPTLTGMGTTFVGIVFKKDSYLVVNVGDSRAFRIRAGQIGQLTEDHTLINELIRSGALSEEQAENHPISHMLTRSLGPAENVQPDCFYYDDGPYGGDIFVLCSDGLYNHVSPADICDVCLSANDVESAAKALVDLANARGGSDNITVIVTEFPEEFGEPVHSHDDTLRLQKGVHDTTVTNGIGVEAEDEESDAQSPVIEQTVGLHDREREIYEDDSEQEGDEFLEEDNEEQLHVQSDEESYSRGSLKYFYVVLGSAIVASIVFSYFPFWKTADKSGDARSASVAVQTPVQPEVVVPPVTKGADQASQVTQGNNRERELPPAEEVVQEVVAELDVFDESFLRTEIDGQVDVLSERIETLELRIRAFNEPLSGRLSELLVESEERLSALNGQLEETRAAIDIASRRLAVWFGRRKRLQRMAPINLAAEVSVSSEEVRRQKEEFDRVTWELLKAEEERRYDPNNDTLKERSAELSLQRTLAMNRLGVAIEKAIDTVLTETDREISELNTKRDALEKTRDRLVDDRAFARVLIKGSKDEKEKLKSQYEQELIYIRSELENIQKMSEEVRN